MTKDKGQKSEDKIMINLSPKSKTRDRYWFKDYKEVVGKQAKIASSSHSLCINCSDYYEIPPCQTNFATDSGCFPSLATDNEYLN
jgi:hypothetical protein